jgi:opacity protein-like surface antigen
MKKFIALAALLATLATSSALAKTEGNYVGIDVLRTSDKHKFKYDENNNGILNTAKFNGTASSGIGINYKHAFNFNQIFLAPGVFFDKLGTNSQFYDAKLKSNYRYGAKLDLGYDITDNFAVYFTNGLSNLNYSVSGNTYEFNEKTYQDDVSGSFKKSRSKLGYVYGAGLSYKIAQNLAVNFEYNAQSLTLKPKVGEGFDVKVASTIRVAKVGLLYNF